ncbi:MAG: IclR family transcriptional regulator [Bifidobacteriaceae bacterium]|jgi:DNA-binding IclR family transcriptional regulator|nr:IclR family transcriptional regulator [Bifidobacteriaceae bacterium]
MSPNAEAADPGVQGLELLGKADAVLTALEAGKAMSATALAAATGEPLSSMYRMLANLVAIGWLDRGEGRGTYRLGLYDVVLGGVCDDRLDLLAASRPQLVELRDATGVTAFLLVPREARGVCVDLVAGRGVRSMDLTLGGSLPLYAGAGPRALLAHLPPGELGPALDAFERWGAADPSVPARSFIERGIRIDAERGYSLSDGDVTPGVAAIGAPVFNHRGESIAAISISGFRQLLLDDGGLARDLVRAAAAKTSALLGHLTTDGRQ